MEIHPDFRELLALFADHRVEYAMDSDLAALDLDSEAAMGYTLKALGAGLWALAHASDFSTGLYRIVSEGGDADSNGAVALLGARFGVGAIPAHLARGLTRTRYLDRAGRELLRAIERTEGASPTERQT